MSTSPNPNPSMEGRATTEAPIARRKHTKSRNGCTACKERKVKCDETTPICRNCQRYFLNPEPCEYVKDVKPLSRKSKAAISQHGGLTAAGSSSSDVVDSRMQSPSPLSSSLAGGAIDPFRTHPPTNEPNVNLLMNHYFQTYPHNLFPYYPTPEINPVKEFYVPLIWADAVLFHVTMLSSGRHMETVKPCVCNSAAAPFPRLMNETLQLLQERVNSEADTSLSDETVAAVAGLAGIEHGRGNVRMFRTHMSGLRRMLDLRGGITAIRQSNPIIASIVFCVFLASVDEPFPPIDLTYEIQRPPWFIDALISLDRTYYLDFEVYGVQPDYAALMQSIRLLAMHYRTAADCSSAPEYQDALTFLYSTFQRLLSLPLPIAYSVDDLDSQLVTEACRHALIVHVFAQWCGHQPDPSLMVSIARHDLQKACRKLLVMPKQTPLLMWLLAVGGVSAAGEMERKWFVGHIAELAHGLNINDGSQFKDCLKRIIWHDVQDEPTHRTLWDEVQALNEDVLSTIQPR